MLLDHWDNEKYLREGSHDVSVTEVRPFVYNSGSDGIEVVLKSQKGPSIKTSFCLHEKAIWKLAGFAKACGLTKDEAASYDEKDPRSHQILMHRRLTIQVKNGINGYAEVVSWTPLDSEAAPALRVVGGTQAEDRRPAPAVAMREPGDDDEIPF